MPTVFLSYSRDDAAYVKQLEAELHAVGIDCWRDTVSLRAGTKWPGAIGKAVNQCDALVLVWTANTIKSHWCEFEWNVALAIRKPVIPVLMTEDGLPISISVLNGVPAQPIARVVEEVKHHVGLTPDAADATAATLLLGQLEQVKAAPTQSGVSKALSKMAVMGKKKRFSAVALAGVALFVVLAAWLVYKFKGEPQTYAVTVFVHKAGHTDKPVLTNRGEVRLIYGNAIVPKQINDKGEVTFNQVPRQYFSGNERVKITFTDPEGEAYEALRPDSLYVLKPNQLINLAVRLQGLDSIFGPVKHFETGLPIAGVRVSVLDVETFSNNNGYYSLRIPKHKQQQFHTLRAYQAGYEAFELSHVAVTGQETPIMLKPRGE